MEMILPEARRLEQHLRGLLSTEGRSDFTLSVTRGEHYDEITVSFDDSGVLTFSVDQGGVNVYLDERMVAEITSRNSDAESVAIGLVRDMLSKRMRLTRFSLAGREIGYQFERMKSGRWVQVSSVDYAVKLPLVHAETIDIEL